MEEQEEYSGESGDYREVEQSGMAAAGWAATDGVW